MWANRVVSKSFYSENSFQNFLSSDLAHNQEIHANRIYSSIILLRYIPVKNSSVIIHGLHFGAFYKLCYGSATKRFLSKCSVEHWIRKRICSFLAKVYHCIFKYIKNLDKILAETVRFPGTICEQKCQTFKWKNTRFRAHLINNLDWNYIRSDSKGEG